MPARRPSPVPEWVPVDLPASPGVYEFEGPGGCPLYVGKSVNVRRRVRGYFYAGGPRDPRLSEMVRLARGVCALPTGSDLEARLEEADRILRRRPPYNRILKNRARGWYVEIDWTDPFPRLRVVPAARRSGAQYVGPFRGRRLPAALARLAEKLCRLRTCAGAVRPDPDGTPCLQHGLGLCTAPCVREVGVNAYRAQVREAAALLVDGARAEAARRELASRRERAEAEGRDGEAAELGRRLAWIVDLEAYRAALERPRVDRSWLLVLPGAQTGGGVLVPVARGRVLPRRPVPWDASWRGAVADACYAVRVAELRARSAFPAEAMAPSLIVTAWLEEGAPGGLALDLERLNAAGAVEAIAARIPAAAEANAARAPAPAPVRYSSALASRSRSG